MHKTKPNGFWKSKCNTLNEARKVKNLLNLGKLPSSRELRKLGYSALAKYIAYHGGFTEFRKLLDETPRVQKGRWKDKEFTLQYGEEILRRHDLAKLPSVRKLESMRYSGFTNSVTHYHGGIKTFRDDLEKRIRQEEKSKTAMME